MLSSFMGLRWNPGPLEVDGQVPLMRSELICHSFSKYRAVCTSAHTDSCSMSDPQPAQPTTLQKSNSNSCKYTSSGTSALWLRELLSWYSVFVVWESKLLSLVHFPAWAKPGFAFTKYFLQLCMARSPRGDVLCCTWCNVSSCIQKSFELTLQPMVMRIGNSEGGRNSNH